MIRTTKKPLRAGAERSLLRRRVTQMVACFNQGQWEKCFVLIDPKLRSNGRVEVSRYSTTMRNFRAVYGSIQPWLIRINLHLDASKNKRDSRTFAYVYIVWQDQARGFHMFRERWIKHDDDWFTRVIGLVPNRRATMVND